MAAVAMIYHKQKDPNPLTSTKAPNLSRGGDKGSFRQRREVELAEKIMKELRGASQPEEPMTRLQRIVRSRVLDKTRLHRKNLAERLRFDAAVLYGTARLVNQVIVFALFVWALRLSSDEQLKRGIFQDLESSFDFAWLRSISSREEFVNEGLPQVSTQSKQYFLLSSSYFDAGGGGSVMILREMEAFTSPKPTVPLALQAPEFSLVAWVATSSQFVEGYLVRKRVSSAGDGAALACWGWYLHSSEGEALHYGGHDFYHTTADPSSSKQVEIGLEAPRGVPTDTHMLLTMTVTEHTVTFYRDLDMIGQSALPRVPTDCFNNGEEVMVGHSGVTLAMVRYYPRALSLSKIKELHTAGGQLSDISTASDPPFLNSSRLDVVERTLAGQLDTVEELVERRGPQSEVAAVLEAVEHLTLNAAEPEPLTVAPLGQIYVNQTLLRDGATGRQYTQLLEGPVYLSQTSEDADHRTLHDVPSFVGTGATLTFWYRHVQCEVENCGVYLFVARNEAELCWSLWLENTAWYFDNVKGDPKFQYPRNFMDPKFNLNGDVTWRHIAMVMDETTDQVRWYLDGVLAWEGPWGSAVAGADCTAVRGDGSDRFVTLGRTEPGYTYGNDVQLYDLRMFVHAAGSPMTSAEVAAIASGAAPGIDATQRCLPISSPLMADTDWRDAWGHGCEWYSANSALYPNLCQYPPARLQCPIGCASRQECLSHGERSAFFSWDRVRRIEAQSPNGTICLSSEWDPDTVLAECRAWVAQGRPDSGRGGIKGWVESLEGPGRVGTRVDLRDCEALASAIDPSCAFDAAAVRNFTEGVHASKGDWTVVFWVKPIGPISKVPARDQFIPHLQFLSTVSPPSHNLNFGAWSNPNGEARILSSCASGKRDENENIEMKLADQDGWTMIAFSRKNYSKVGDVESGESMVTTNMLQSWEGTFLPQCLYDPAAFFNALEINYPMLISPIMMVPQAIPYAEIQQTYFKLADDMKVRGGPLVSNAKREQQQEIAVEKREFAPRSVLMAPPIIFQQRAEAAASCPFEYSDSLIEQQHAQMITSKCAPPFKCEAEVLADARQTIACPGAAMREGTHFEISPMDLDGKRGYPELLFSITDNPFLWRDGRLTDTADFVDVLTESVEVILVFFTPKFGITSVLTVMADFSGSLAADVEVTLSHYEILEGRSLSLYLIAQIVVLVSIGFMIMDICWSVTETLRDARSNRSWPELSRVAKAVTDTAIAGMVIVFIAYRIPSKSASSAETEHILGSLGAIPWDSVDKGLAEKLQLFFSAVLDLLGLIRIEQDLNDFCNIILLLSLFRVIQCTSLHPRLALLTGTLIKAVDDLWHATLLIVLLMCCFAAIATWRFGSERADFASFDMSMQTQFMMTFGEFPVDWNETGDLRVYTVLYFLLVFLLVQNFLLAIIVEAFIKVREANLELQTEQEFTQDVVASVYANLMGWYRGWPRLHDLGVTLEQWNAKYSVGFKELWATGLFKTHRGVSTFINFYKRFDFLEPVAIKKHAPVKEGDESTRALVAELAGMLGVAQPTLREEAEQHLSKASLRRQLKQNLKLKDGGEAEAGAAGLASPTRELSGAVVPEAWARQSSALHSGTDSLPAARSPVEATDTLAAGLDSVQGQLTAQLDAVRGRLQRMEGKVEEDSRNIREILRLLKAAPPADGGAQSGGDGELAALLPGASY